MLEAIYKVAAGLPSTVLRMVFLPAVMGLGFLIYTQGTRIAELEKAQIRVQEQRANEIQAIKDLTDEVRQSRSEARAYAQKQEDWAQSILRGGHR